MIHKASTLQALSVKAPHAVAVAAGLMLLASPASAQSNDVAAGKKAAEFVCRNCHDVSGSQQAKNPPGGAPSFFEVAQKPETTEKSLHKFLTLPHGRMINVLLSGKEIDHVTAYIMSLRHQAK